MLEITSIAADLMRIFAQRHYSNDRYDDTTAIELLKYLQTLAHAEKVPTPKLDQYLAGVTKLVFTGGTSELLREEIKEVIPGATICDEAEKTNVRGFLKALTE